MIGEAGTTGLKLAGYRAEPLGRFVAEAHQAGRDASQHLMMFAYAGGKDCQ